MTILAIFWGMIVECYPPVDIMTSVNAGVDSERDDIVAVSC